MFVAFVTFIGMGVPQAHPGDYSSPSPAVFFLVSVPLLTFAGWLVSRIRRRRTAPEIPQLAAGKKPCKYCGRENDEEAINCTECGAPFPTLQPDLPACEHETPAT
jgi:hypothetical protein